MPNITIRRYGKIKFGRSGFGPHTQTQSNWFFDKPIQVVSAAALYFWPRMEKKSDRYVNIVPVYYLLYNSIKKCELDLDTVRHSHMKETKIQSGS